MKWIFKLFNFLHMVPAFTRNDEDLNDANENSLREYAQVVSQVKDAAEQRTRGNLKLRAALAEARERIEGFNPLGDFERALHHSSDEDAHHERPARVRGPNQ